ncbi:MAG: hypothetical protein WDN69_31955 [Aliidongia sp.]
MSPPLIEIDAAIARICLAACDAAYDNDPNVRAAALAVAGITELAYLQGAIDARALYCQKDDQRYLAFQGTQFTEVEITSILANLQSDPVDIGGGRQVHAGYWGQLQALLPLVLPAVAGHPCIITGHSMGGTISHLTQATPLIEIMQGIVSFGAPKSANAAFWASVDQRNVTRLVNACDFAPTYPLLPQEWVQPEHGEFWLHGGGLEWLPGQDARPVLADSVPDHMLPAYAASLGVTLG